MPARSRSKASAVAPDQLELLFGESPATASPTAAPAPKENAFADTSAPPADPGFSPLDDRFADLIIRLHGHEHELLRRAARAVSAARGAGDSCLPLARLGNPSALAAELHACSLVGEPGAWQPLILDSTGRLYLQRYWAYEQTLATALASRLQAPPPPPLPGWFAAELKTAISGDAEDQRQAVRTAALSRLCLITGGPGTGKTRTAATLLALLEKLASSVDEPLPRVALAAPTGKAATRLLDSIRQVWAELKKDAEPPTYVASTLHRLLGLTGDSPVPRHHAQNPIPADVIIVDEASMIDLAMMAKLFAAAPPTARLILLGDREQLPPVETGRVFGELCSAAIPRLSSQVVALRKNFRFSEASRIKQVSDAVQSGDVDKVLALLQDPSGEDLQASETPSSDKLADALALVAVPGFRPVFEHMHDPAAALEALDRFRLLCALRQGPHGLANLNRLVESALAEVGLLRLPIARHYPGRAIMITRNDYPLRLFNGDVGLVLPDPEAGGDLRAFFRGEDGTLRRLSPARLPEHETAWAMTVHKSQGSEFQEVLLILPDRETPVVTRELIYTGLTRARHKVQVWYAPAPLRQALENQSQSASGLTDAIIESLPRD